MGTRLERLSVFAGVVAVILWIVGIVSPQACRTTS